MISSTMTDDDVISISTHVVGFIYYINEMDSGENIVLMREPLWCYDKWEILVMLMDGDTIGHVAKTCSVALGPVLDFISRNESGATFTYITGKCKWTCVGQGYPIDVLIIVPVPMRLHIVGILDQCDINWR
eukprot:871196-Ditylum_brightwellii.AAC.1